MCKNTNSPGVARVSICRYTCTKHLLPGASRWDSRGQQTRAGSTRSRASSVCVGGPCDKLSCALLFVFSSEMVPAVHKQSGNPLAAVHFQPTAVEDTSASWERPFLSRLWSPRIVQILCFAIFVNPHRFDILEREARWDQFELAI
jgi:hypothetical protein